MSYAFLDDLGINFGIILRVKKRFQHSEESRARFAAFGRSFGGEGRWPTELARDRGLPGGVVKHTFCQNVSISCGSGADVRMHARHTSIENRLKSIF